MFGFPGGESAETVSRKKDYRKGARERWPFLTIYDLSTDQERSSAPFDGEGTSRD